MEGKAPTILIVLVETAKLRWFVAGLGLDGALAPLICSDEDDLSPYRGLDFAEQLAFLRHRFCGVLQRGCNRLWEQQKKACQFVFLFEGRLAETSGAPPGALTEGIADHMVEWMLNPPVAALISPPGSAAGTLERLAGDLEPERQALLLAHLGSLRQAREDPGAWVQVRHRGSWLASAGAQ